MKRARSYQPSRRELLKLLGGGLLVPVFAAKASGCVEPAPSLAQGGESGRGGRGNQSPQNLSAWLHIGEDGRATVFTGKVEVGQNARTSLTQGVAEELRLPMESVLMVMGDTDLCPFDQGTFGSRTTPSMMPQLRQAAASARETLIDLAAEKWGVARAGLTAENGKVVRGSGSDRAELGYGELAKSMPPDKPIRNVPLTLTKEWKVMGKAHAKVDARDIVTGKHRYASDMVRPSMRHAKILRPPSPWATPESVESSATHSGDFQIVQMSGLAASLAVNSRQAEAGLEAINARWREDEKPSARDLFKTLRGQPVTPGSNAGIQTSELSPTGPPPSNEIAATYTTGYIAHVPLEPRAALAEWDGKRMTVYTGSQRPFGVRQEVAQALKLDESAVRVIVPDTGSGYGGKHSGEAAVEAARLAMATKKPVKVVWTRQEEFTFAYMRPAGVIEVKATLGPGGSIASWQFDNYNSGGAAIETPYAIPGARAQFHRADSPLRQGSYRGLASTFNNFARESHMDEMALAARMDPLAFRLKNLQNERLLAVLNKAADAFGWGKIKSTRERGCGLACGIDKGGYVANCVEVDLSSYEPKVARAVTAFECGAIINPEQLKNQVEGSVIMGLGGALFEAIDYQNGRLVTDRLSAYRVPRFSDVPKMETHLVNRPDLPSAGAGECPIMAIAPAIGNAIRAARGIRLYGMPMKLEL